MPKRSGQKVLYELQKDKDLSRIPVLIVTAHASTEMGKEQMEELIEGAALSGPGLYLEKPVSPLAYVRCVQRALGLEESEETASKIGLKEELEERLKGAGPDALRRALEALDKD
jgi:response regulator RpfG family c-di-GMP phosphodiesterase